VPSGCASFAASYFNITFFLVFAPVRAGSLTAEFPFYPTGNCIVGAPFFSPLIPESLFY